MMTSAGKKDKKEKLLSLKSTQSATTEVTINIVSGTDIILTYDTMAGNQPSTNGNTVFLWQASNAVLYAQTPLASQGVPTNTQSGSMDFTGLSIQPTTAYTVGYAVGPDVTNVCAYSSIEANGTIDAPFTSQISADPKGITPNAVLLQYITPVGNQPATNGNWIGIWIGTSVPVSGAPLKKATITADKEAGQQALIVSLQRGTTYTCGYFMGAKQTMLAASFTFTTSA